MVRKKFNKKEIIRDILYTVIIITIFIFYIWHQSKSISLGYKNGELEERIISLRKEIEKLQAKKSSLLSLERVEKIAKEELKLKEPRKDQIVYEDFGTDF